jgi:23S rRNA (uracil1939-C5)-methyltransferase
LELTIEKLVYGGDGLARRAEDDSGRRQAVFLPFVLQGERVEATIYQQKRGFARGRADRILESSSHRVEALCPYFQRCGGCHYQHASYEHQLASKVRILQENLLRIAKLELAAELKVHPSPPWNYRNRSRLRVRTLPEFALGYYRFGSHELLPVEQCPISSPLINRAIAVCWQLGRAGEGFSGVQEIEFFANAEDTELLAEVQVAPELSPDAARSWAQALRHALPELSGVAAFKAQTPDPSGLKPSMPELLVSEGAGELLYQTRRGSYRVSAGAFFQVNRYLAEELIDTVTGDCSGGTALDLYAGVGFFSSVLNRKFERVIAVEASSISHADLLRNSPPNVKAICSTTEKYLKNVVGKLQPDLVVVDPPRSGLGKSISDELVRLASPQITYVSCDPATLARDLVGLLAAGYRIQSAHLVDLFPQTYHLESVFRLAR